MENASKALIIAGAILVSILIIGVGMMVMQGGQGVIDSAVLQMSSQEKEVFNQNFTRYAGTRVTGSNVRALIQNVISSNHTNQDIEGKLVSISGNALENELKVKVGALQANEMSAARSKINTGATYSVEMKYNDTTGLVEEIVINKSGSTK